ncbi:MAG: hypothetical protein HDQ99_05630 [Lachnospiraceae bacterium]|nr:hypothetical protein [Lachnospiraceae bacterium]
MITSKYFNMGKIVVTHGINEAMKENDHFAAEVNLSLQRYAVKDWGSVSDNDKQMNENAIRYPDDLYILAAYETCKGKIWIITNRISETDGDNATTVCFPSER